MCRVVLSYAVGPVEHHEVTNAVNSVIFAVRREFLKMPCRRISYKTFSFIYALQAQQLWADLSNVDFYSKPATGNSFGNHSVIHCRPWAIYI